MTRNKPDEPIVVHKGAPPKRQDFSVIQLFGIVAFLVAILILGFSSGLQQLNTNIGGGYGLISLTLSGLAIAILVGAVQGWILRRYIHHNNAIAYVGCAAGGGVVGGLCAGVIRSAAAPSIGAASGLIVGAALGLAAGAVSSLLQNSFMRSQHLKQRWFLFSLVSWTAIWAVGWAIGWGVNTSTGTALAVAFILLASGGALWVFQESNRVEF